MERLFRIITRLQLSFVSHWFEIDPIPADIKKNRIITSTIDHRSMPYSFEERGRKRRKNRERKTSFFLFLRFSNEIPGVDNSCGGGKTVALIHRRLINHYVRLAGLLDWKRGVTTMNYGMTDQLPRRALWRWPQRTTNSRLDADLVKPLAKFHLCAFLY